MRIMEDILPSQINLEAATSPKLQNHIYPRCSVHASIPGEENNWGKKQNWFLEEYWSHPKTANENVLFKSAKMVLVCSLFLSSFENDLSSHFGFDGMAEEKLI